MAQNIYSVDKITSYIKSMFSRDFILRNISVSGEISSCKYHASGHIFFTLSGAGATLSSVVYSGNKGGIPFRLKEGMRIVATGEISVYEKNGTYSLNAKSIRLEDEKGELYEKLRKLKEELADRGLFADEYKKPIPPYIRTLGVVTADTGAAIQDIISVTQKRNPYVKILLYPARVQGEYAVQEIIRGIEALERAGVDCMIVGRGGGSREDLWTFNNEQIAQAIFDCSIPIISAVGHKIDETVADLVADAHVETPTAAANLAVFNYELFLSDLESMRRMLTDRMNGKLERKKSNLELLSSRLMIYRPHHQITEKKQMLDRAEERLHVRMNQKLKDYEQRLALLAQRLQGNSPLEKISKGYAFVLKEDGERLDSAERTGEGELLTLYLSDGVVRARVEGKPEITERK